ncbi:XRE family transcriptional regulator [Paenibacillus sp. HW567]|uniref:XRE family transcriptional regulator n=1 Tax=Paenibacillus sp. HW567 TaxID=1034769 RepID=UPI00037A6CFA|nr:helix-turn-helix transcriptional regulator [Paenibacillus sp. HW567]
MIKNEKEYEVTKREVSNFIESLDKLELDREGMHPKLYQLYKDAMISQLNDLEDEVREYESLKDSHLYFRINSLTELPRIITKARISEGYSQETFAAFLGLPYEELYKLENNDYVYADINLLIDIAEKLKVDFPEEKVKIYENVSVTSTIKKLLALGMNSKFVFERIIPTKFLLKGSNVAHLGIVAMLEYLQKIFQWDPKDILEGTQMETSLLPVSMARFKMPKNAKESWANVYTNYAYYIAELLSKSIEDKPVKYIPSDWKIVNSEILERYGEVSFTSVLSFVWDLGIAVIPLKDTGAFHGAFWRMSGRNIILLKQKSSSSSRWAFDLLHELFHALQEPEASERTIIEENGDLDNEEKHANQFAGNVLLNGRANELAQKCVVISKGSLERLKGTVVKVAKDEKVSASSLANYLAFRLSLQGQDWWGAASNLQLNDSNEPFKIAKEVLLNNIDFKKLDEAETEIVLQALSENEVIV